MTSVCWGELTRQQKHAYCVCVCIRAHTHICYILGRKENQSHPHNMPEHVRQTGKCKGKINTCRNIPSTSPTWYEKLEGKCVRSLFQGTYLGHKAQIKSFDGNSNSCPVVSQQSDMPQGCSGEWDAVIFTYCHMNQLRLQICLNYHNKPSHKEVFCGHWTFAHGFN